ncbi:MULTISPECIES: thiol peroxidase [Pseudoalteromonas]|uniref:Redoxin n=2 Tax=Pseudoalteromonas TaxID=53246 RepID=A0A0F4PIB0_9GAMM|nr:MULTISPECIES: thiol peroxidase [Pseudoalteromonas]KJY95240.1 redoxin [Pseudoalteromonas ruthenica]KJY96167.1 redoxin [Pseudoalteromonas ruthenica]MCF2863933.1 thiol peroxidase [Pseudoalteromonas sp. CNAT2-18]MCG7558600.1 thiol peroxidase [Pseudoalteromonas sp. CNAT2-18.1]MCG7565379.1 thiol peroxidase [Pseudoalteromonas sp. CnMc7-15]|tara:strand:- start:1960 stop:2547 length:588 start_codon:yes stop_codon:yes gene_type:complete
MFKKLALCTLLTCSTVALAQQSETINTIDAGKVTAQGKPVTLLGKGVKVGDAAPDFRTVNAQFEPRSLNDYQGKAVLLSVVPSLDTGVCSIQTKHFNEKVASEFPQVAMLTVSTDLPFAQKRYCAAEGIDKLETLSDAVWRDFGEQYGLLIKDMGLLSRAVLVLDKDHKVIYKQLVSDLSKEPNYDHAIRALNSL